MIACYLTGHEIADTVMTRVARGNGYTLRHVSEPFHSAKVHVAYGILRGTADIFREAKRRGERFIFLDKGFMGAKHYDGYYRVGVNRFQQDYQPHAFGDERTSSKWHPFREVNFETMEVFWPHWRGEEILVIPPTEHICQFYNLGSPRIWLKETMASIVDHSARPIRVRFKTDGEPLNHHLSKAFAVVTHSSSVAWEAMRYGIPVISDPACVTHNLMPLTLRDLENESAIQVDEQMVMSLLKFMSHYQFTLDELATGTARHLIEGVV